MRPFDGGLAREGRAHGGTAGVVKRSRIQHSLVEECSHIENDDQTNTHQLHPFWHTLSVFSQATTCTRANHKGVGMRAAAITASLIRLCIRYGVSFTLENPAGWQLFSYPPIQRIADRRDTFLVRVDYCMFGCCYQKATSLLTNIASLKELECTCDRQHQHLQLAGTGANHLTGKQIWRTTVSGRYPPLLCQEWARLVARSLPAPAIGRDATDVECRDLHLALCAAHNAKDCILRPKCPSGPVLE